jgi:hypothetical protein
MSNIIEGIQEECKRVREELIPRYESIGPSGMFGRAMLAMAVNEGEAAIASGDVVRMISAYKSLKESQ